MSRIFLFLDLETTGLDPDRECIIEFAWAFTDEAFNIIGEPRTFLVEPLGWDRFWSSLRGNDTVRNMHTASGLLRDLTTGDPMDLDFVALALEAEIEALPEYDSIHLAGASVHFDRAFLEANGFRRLLYRIHHRHLDLSAVKLLLSACSVPFTATTNQNPHRALSDVLDSIAQARAFAGELSTTALPA